MVRHFRDGHGLRTIEDVEAKARELNNKEAVRESRFTDPNLLRLVLARLTDVVISMASRLNLVGFTEGGYVCGLCSRKFTNEFELAEHLASYHYAELTEQPQPGTE